VLSSTDLRRSFQNAEGAAKTDDVHEGAGTNIVLYLADAVDRRSIIALFPYVFFLPRSATVNVCIILIPLRFALISFDDGTFSRLLEKGLVKWYVSSLWPCCHMIQHRYRYSVALSARMSG